MKTNPSSNPESFVGKIIHIGKQSIKIVSIVSGVLFGVLLANDANAQCPDTPDQVEKNTIDKMCDTGSQSIQVTINSNYPHMMVDDVNHQSWGSTETEWPNSQIDYKTDEWTGTVDIWIRNPGDESQCNEGRTVEVVDNLPIELYNFDVTVTKDSILYDYVTGSEVNVDHVEAKARDGESDFQTVKEEKYEENVLGGRQHHIALALEEFIDKTNAVPGETMYGRLKSVDSDGKTVFYKIVSFILKKDKTIDEKSIIIYPNPASDKVHVKNTNEKQEVQTIDVFNTLNKKVKQVQGKSLDVKDLPFGTYILRITLKNGKVITKKLVV